MRPVALARGQHDLGVGSQLDLARLVPVIGYRHTANFGVFLWRNCHVEGRCDRPIAPDDFDAIL